MNREQLLSLLFYPMSAFVGLIIVLSIIVFLQKKQSWPYRKVPIMSEIEKKLYKQLLDAFPDYFIFAQVQLSRVIRPPKGKNEYKWLNKIWRLSLDYVILNSKFETIAVIELDDASHSLPKRREVDQRKSKALKAAGIHLVRIKTSNMPAAKQELLTLIGI